MFRRFDNVFMQPPAPRLPVDEPLLRSLRDWCETGASPRMTVPFSAASIAPHPGLDGVACELDGGHALARLHRWQGLAWRLQVLLRDHLPGRNVRRDDPWDCGWWRPGSLASAAAFRPRRPTLLLLRGPGQAAADGLLATLQDRSPSYRKPLRVLVVSDSAHPGLRRL